MAVTRFPHYFLPNSSFAICHLCGAHAEKEENEISRHYGKVHEGTHPHFSGRGNTPYHLIKMVPQQVAEDLVGQERVARLNCKLSYTAENAGPKSEYATVADMARLYGFQGIPVSAWVSTFDWPPVPAAAAIQQAGPPPALPPQPTTRLPKRRPNLIDLDDEGDTNFDEDESMDNADDEEAAAADDETEDDDIFSKTLPAIMPRPGMICDHEDPSAEPDEPIYTCIVHKRENLGPRPLIAGNLRSMYNHCNQWHPDTLRQAFHDSYDTLYIEELITRGLTNRELADAAGPVIESNEPRAGAKQTLRCYVCMAEGESFGEMDQHFREQHEDERWNIAEGVFDQWTHWEGVEGYIVVQGKAGYGRNA